MTKVNHSAEQYAVPRWLRARVRVWQRRCQCEAWEINVVMQKLGSKHGALTSYVQGYKTAVMTFDPGDYANRTEVEMDRQIAHEFYHLLASYEETALEKIIGSGTALEKYTDEQEHLAEAFGSIMVAAYKKKRSV